MITSTRNPLVKTFQRLGAHPGSDPDRRILLDGLRLIEDALTAGVRFEAVLVAADAAPRVHALAGRLRATGARVHEAAPHVVQAASRVDTSQGIVALADRPEAGTEAILGQRDLLLLVADRVADPGNLGTMIRTAVAAGASAVAVTPGTADPFLPKVLRSTMGAAFRIPVLHADAPTLRSRLSARSVRVLVADPRGTTDYTVAPVALPVAIVVGNEVAGPQALWLETGTSVRIPLMGPVESLNVTVAAALLLYEVRRRAWVI